MQQLAALCDAIAATPAKNQKIRLVADHLCSRPEGEAALAALFLSGRIFPAYEETTMQVGGAFLWRVLADISGKRDAVLTAAYRKHGDLGWVAHDMLLPVAPQVSTLTLAEIAAHFRQIALARTQEAKSALLQRLLSRATALEAKYLVKIMTGDLRIGLRESLVEEAIAKAYGAPVAEVQRANMLLGDISETLRLAAHAKLPQARMRLFHPISFMLASPVETASEAFECFHRAAVEDKYDGIRAQAHCASGKARLFSRTLDDVSDSFPELVLALQSFSEELVLDGEIVAWQRNSQTTGRALPFSELQKRLGRKKVTVAIMRAVPVAYIAFDVLYAGRELAIDQPLHQRAAILDRIFATARAPVTVRTPDPQGKLAFEPAVPAADHSAEEADMDEAQIIRAPVLQANSPQELENLFEMAQSRGNEGLMIKDLDSVYTPGRRGRSWIKLKRELATLDVVVTAAEYGHGKRAGVLSDYTFAVRDGERLLNIGKAYSGLTDIEIAELTQWFLEHTIDDLGFVRMVEPRIVLEVAFNAVMRSGRHNSGFALRFPRILRIRSDKLAEDIDTLERVREIYERQQWPQTA